MILQTSAMSCRPVWWSAPHPCSVTPCASESPRRIKSDEHRVAITPSGVAAFVARGHDVVIEAGAGIGSAIPDETYRAAGTAVVDGPDAVWERADLVLKVKEPLESGVRPNATRPGPLHLPALGRVAPN